MRAERVPGLRPWVVATGENSWTIYEGVNPPSPEWIKNAKRVAKFLIEVVHPSVMAECEKEFTEMRRFGIPCS